MIEQIRDILIDIENSTVEIEKINYALEVCKLVFENTKLNEMQYRKLETEDMIIDSVLSIDEIVKFTSDFFEHSLKYLENDLKGSDFEVDIQNNLKQLQELNNKFTLSTENYKKLKETTQETKKIQTEIDELQSKIYEYEEVDLEKIKLEKEQMALKLVELERTEGNNLKIYQRHLAENNKVNMHTSKLSSLSHTIEKDLLEMDGVLNAR